MVWRYSFTLSPKVQKISINSSLSIPIYFLLKVLYLSAQVLHRGHMWCWLKKKNTQDSRSTNYGCWSAQVSTFAIICDYNYINPLVQFDLICNWMKRMSKVIGDAVFLKSINICLKSSFQQTCAKCVCVSHSRVSLVSNKLIANLIDKLIQKPKLVFSQQPASFCHFF